MKIKAFEPGRKDAENIRVSQLIVESIRGLDPGTKLPPIRELMKRLNTKMGTVVKVLEKLEKEGLITKRWGDGIYINETEKRVRKRSVGVIVADISDRYCSLLVKGIESGLSSMNYKMVLGNGQEDFRKELAVIHSFKEDIDGLIVHSNTTNIHHPEYSEFFTVLMAHEHYPVLMIDKCIPGVNTNLIKFDNCNSFKRVTLAVLPVLQKSHKCIFFGSFENSDSIDRYYGVVEGCKSSGAPISSLESVNVLISHPEKVITDTLFNTKGPYLIFCGTPLLLPKILQVLAEKKLRSVKDYILVSVVEEDYKAYVNVPIIGIVKPAIRLGRRAAEIIEAMIEGKKCLVMETIEMHIEIPEAIGIFCKLKHESFQPSRIV